MTTNADDIRLANIKDPDDDLSGEELQELADIKREEQLEVDPNAFDVVAGDIAGLSINEKYAVVLGQVRKRGPLFFIQTDPTTFALPPADPLNLIWINLMTGWHIASIILSQFEQNIVDTDEAMEKEEENNNDGNAAETTDKENIPNTNNSNPATTQAENV